MSSGFSTLSMKDGMGVPLTPVARRMAMSSGAGPPRKVHRLVRFAGLIGRPQSSFSSGREGPSARPSVPWHLLHSIASNISLPRLIDSVDEATSLGSSSFLGASLNLSAAKVFTYDKFKEAPKKLELPKEVASSTESIKRGKEMFEAIECHKCHGTEGRADGPSRAELKDEGGHPIAPANSTNRWTLRRGAPQTRVGLCR